ncbi:MAG: ribonuclease R [Acidobacteria bacterium]|nr:ribonuclease R [Acidobacteriota bacterium]
MTLITADLSPQKILQALPKSRDRAICASDLADALMLTEAQRAQLAALLEKFERTGLAAIKGERYWRKPNPALFIGTLRCTRTGYAFVVPDDEHERKRGDFFIHEKNSGAAMQGDKVIVRLTAQAARGREGRIESVLQRANKTIVGRFYKAGKENIVSPIDARLLFDIVIAATDTLNANQGDIVNVEITRPPAARYLPTGRVIEVLGDEHAQGIDIEIIIRKHRLPHIFPDAVLQEAANISAKIGADEINKRVDLRSQLTLTIDGETAKDFDDAVSLERLANGRVRLGVHIADVSHYVREGSALDEEALRRGTSVYFPERAIPMLPEALSNEICSLKPQVDRLTLSALMELDHKGKVVDYQLAPTIIHSAARMTYTAVNEIISNPEGETAIAHTHLKAMILQMHEVARLLIGRREERGAIDFDLPEAEVRFNDEGQIGGIVRSERNIAHRLIEEFMLLANETVAKHLERLKVPSLYRIHDEPNPLKVEEFAEIASSFGHNFSMNGPLPQRGFQHLAREIAGQPEERMLSYLMLRSMQRAKYTPKNVGHFGLAMKSYTHFTSPIRRYPDLIVHRILREVFAQGKRGDEEWQALDLGRKYALKKVDWPVFAEDREAAMRRELEAIGEQASLRERAADEAERELMDWRKADFIAQHIGDEFDGVITSVKDFGFYVELNEVFVEGLVHISTLRDGVYEYNERKHFLKEKRSGRKLQLGEVVRVAVDRVDRQQHLIDFSLVETGKKVFADKKTENRKPTFGGKNEKPSFARKKPKKKLKKSDKAKKRKTA